MFATHHSLSLHLGRAHWLKRAAFAYLCVATAVLASCATPTQHAQRTAQLAKLEEIVLQGTRFRHRSFMRYTERMGNVLTVFIDSDGSPWSNDGMKAATDPTARIPVALRLAAQTQGNVLYLGRPCYLGFSSDANCNETDWTNGRYSQGVIDSMIAALNEFVRAHGINKATLIGYSGGGTIAVLMAHRTTTVGRVITVGANLDTSAWSKLHGYLPLARSLNPTDDPPSRVDEVHLSGAHDSNVPRDSIHNYLLQHPSARVRTFSEFDHVCCWERDWVAILEEIEASAEH